MNGRRLGSAAVLLALGSLTGCASWCARNYPCQAAPAAYAPAPCYCAPAPACQPVSYSPTWQQPAGAACAPCAPHP
jgi:hypothetical protein